MSTAPALDPAHTALLVMDFQPAILALLPESDRDALLGRMEMVISDIRARGGTVAYVRVGFTEADWAAIPATNRSFAPIAQHRLLHHADPDTAVHERLAPQDGDILVRKIRYGGLSTTDLDQRLRARGISTLIIAGISTSGVVLSTVLDAADRDYRLYVLADAVADPDPETHDVLLQQVFPARAHILDTAGLHTLLRADRRRPAAPEDVPSPDPLPPPEATMKGGIARKGHPGGPRECADDREYPTPTGRQA
ncbi:cysteine hydrolase [Nonomuraea sp. NPDC049709]|uniref:cysteine hydrolase family protein n=1 Tax=Nonomuraea sp. NPDC049709 TaxID=3154736 RepID=UPI00343D1F29